MDVLRRVNDFAEGFRTLGNSDVRAAHLFDAVQDVNRAIDAIEASSRDGGPGR